MLLSIEEMVWLFILFLENGTWNKLKVMDFESQKSLDMKTINSMKDSSLMGKSKVLEDFLTRISFTSDHSIKTSFMATDITTRSNTNALESLTKITSLDMELCALPVSISQESSNHGIWMGLGRSDIQIILDGLENGLRDQLDLEFSHLQTDKDLSLSLRMYFDKSSTL